MNDDRIHVLWSRYLAGDALSESEREQLREALESGDRSFHEEAELDGLLRGLGSFSEDPETFERSFREFLAAKKSETDFIRRVLRRRSERSSFPAAALIAAGVIAAAILICVLTPTAEPRKPRETVRQVREEPAPREVPKPPPAEPAPREEPARKDPEPEGERIDRELREAIARPKPPLPVPAPREEKPREPAPAPPRPPEIPPPVPSQTLGPVVAAIEAVEGEAAFVTGQNRSPVKAGASLSSGQGLETGGGAARVVLVFADKTRVELGPETVLDDVKTAGGKQIALARGTVRAEVVKQPKDQPLIFTTPHGEAKVVGTTLRLVVDPDAKKGTRLEVEEGKVELRNLAKKMVVVETGHYAVAAGAMTGPFFQELPGWLLYVRAATGGIKFGAPAELVDDPLEPGGKCFRLKYPSNCQGLVLPLAAKIPVEEFDGVSFEAYVPVNGPKGCVITSDARDTRNLFASATRQNPKRGSWQKIVFRKADYKQGDPLSGMVTNVYVCEHLPDLPANATPEHEFYLRRIQVRRSR